MALVGRSILLVVTLALSAVGTRAGETVRGPIDGAVVRVIDGDTFEFVARVWLGLSLTTNVRIRGIDTPEVRGQCQKEKDLARQATLRLAALIAEGVALTDVADDKYFGRVVANVTASGGMDVGAAMIASGLARPYDGSARQPWCEAAAMVR